ncbi:hypothetical protein Mal4_43540 [Maioricimonas rarisocia]|uniref:Outer membrane efflux protein n=1 Tax=Maioricimonas rarisocia TaxID=2528026 RepID=A0A517ZC32_9PLAN|nr:TolC family protein [Maioricimonas rarisocia]QDU40000.1 hypothetical protein Mal4_43540 [Maioricimonas rarisocia]
MLSARWRWGARLLLGATLGGMTIGTVGCHRSYYREQADIEATALIYEKSDDPRWAVHDFTIQPDRRSRYADPYNPDFPPMPPDDPASHQLMHCVYGKKGYSKWDENGHIVDLENPGWEMYLGEYARFDEDGNVLLGLEDAVRIARIHSPDYQEELETLYLSALDVSTERFRFDVQFFGNVDLTTQHLGQVRPGGELNALTLDTGLTARKQLATAGELLVGFANSTVWEFTGNDSTFTTSLLNFSFIQPLLRAGGRAVALEQLTIAERTLLGNLRAMERYRQGFFTDIAIGESGVQGPQRRGGFFGGTGLTGFTGTGSGGFGGVGAATGFGGGFGGGGAGGATGGGSGFAGGGAGTVGGFIGLLQRLQQIRNTENALNLQLRTLALLEANLDAGLIDIAQVDQFRQSIETERANLLQARNALESSFDNFKRDTLGLPPDLPMALDDQYIHQFQFISPSLSETQGLINEDLDTFGELALEPEPERLRATFDRLDADREALLAHVNDIPVDFDKLMDAAPKRLAAMTETERNLFERDVERLRDNLESLRQRLNGIGDAVATLRETLTDENTSVIADSIVEQFTELKNIAGELSLVQARARLEAITVEKIDLTPEVALEIARANRLDWMNNRAALVDTWRLIEFNANRLKSDLSIEFEGDIQTVGNNPVRFRDSNGSLRASIQFDPPLTRLTERNNFRQQLIEYQQSRRQMIQFEDGIHQTMRQILRDIEQLRVNLEIQRRAVTIAIRRVDQTRETLSEPVPPTQPGQPPQALGPTAAQNLLFALSDLRNTQDNLMSVWLNYEAAIMRLYRELGIMAIDADNMWDRQPIFLSDRMDASEDPLPPAVPPEWFQQLDTPPEPGDADLQQVPPAPPADDQGPQLPGDPQAAEEPRSLIRLTGWLDREKEQAVTGPNDPPQEPSQLATAPDASTPAADVPPTVVEMLSKLRSSGQPSPKQRPVRPSRPGPATHFRIVAPPDTKSAPTGRVAEQPPVGE